MWCGGEGGKSFMARRLCFPHVFNVYSYLFKHKMTVQLFSFALSISVHTFFLLPIHNCSKRGMKQPPQKKRGGGGWIPFTSMNIAAAAASAIILAALATVFPFPPFIRPRWGFIREAKGVGGGFKRSPPMFVSFFYVRGEVLERFLNLSLFVKNRWKLNRQ